MAHLIAGAAEGGLSAAANAEGLKVLESHVDFMSLFYRHMTACPPHGPFLYYCAMTLVERARYRYSCRLPVLAEQQQSALPGSEEHAMTGLLAALTIPNVLHLIEQRYQTAHLSSWPLLYVPAEVRAADVDALIAKQSEP